MAANDIELILSRQLAETLSVPTFITDTEGNLLFYNESAEEILGQSFDDTGEMSIDVWTKIFEPLDLYGQPIPAEELPLVRTLNERIPAHGTFWIKSLKGVSINISVTAYPLIGRGNRYVGAVALFWANS